MCVLLFFFFKQKTAYELRISDWSSDVCSSDLALQARPSSISSGGTASRPAAQDSTSGKNAIRKVMTMRGSSLAPSSTTRIGRSEEHTSELQSLMRISYAVFCLKKKNKHAKDTRVAQPEQPQHIAAQTQIK